MNSNVVLINPKIYEASQNKRINAIVNITFPSSLGILAGCLNASDIGVEIIDEQIDSLGDNDLQRLLNSMCTPRIIGLSVLTINSGRAYELSEKVKQIDPEAIVVMGGIHPTVATDEVINAKGVDVVVRGEGELTFIELVGLILQGKDYRSIAGISFKKNGVPVHNVARSLVENLDDIPTFPYHIFDKNLHRYPNFSSINGSRGCPYACIFCSSRSISGKRYRFHSVERVLRECVTLVRKYKQRSIFFLDDNIAVNKRHFIELCNGIIKEGLHKEAFFHGSMRADNATDEILELAVEANFKIIYFGFETGVERLMKLIDKGETVADVVAAIKRAHRKGLSIGTTLIFGLPTETRADRWETIKLVRSLPVESVRFNTLAPYPGTPAYDTLYPQEKILIKNNWENFGVQYMWESDDIPFVPSESKRLELIFDTMFANISYYLSPKGLWKLLKAPVAGGNVIKLKQKWYLSPDELLKMGSAFFYLFSRFIGVTVRMCWGMIGQKSRKTFKITNAPL